MGIPLKVLGVFEGSNCLGLELKKGDNKGKDSLEVAS
jgi:hypothetical protein